MQKGYIIVLLTMFLSGCYTLGHESQQPPSGESLERAGCDPSFSAAEGCRIMWHDPNRIGDYSND